MEIEFDRDETWIKIEHYRKSSICRFITTGEKRMRYRFWIRMLAAIVMSPVGLPAQSPADVGAPVADRKAAVLVAPVFGDHAVLQREMPVPVWGRSEPGTTVTVECAGQKKSTITDKDGKWLVKLDPLKANATPQEMVISDSSGNNVTLKDLLVGEVWLASGQSNMEWPLANAPQSKDSFPDLDKSLVRVLTVKKAVSSGPADSVEGNWVPLDSPTGSQSSAVAGFFAMNLLDELKIPIGILSSSWGGCRIEPWIPQESFERIEGIGKDGRGHLTEEQIQDLAKRVWDMDGPGLMYNAMIHPLVGFPIRGAIWYQGESNVGDAYWYQKRPYTGDGVYGEKMTALIHSWRKAWNMGEFPFYFVQLAPHGKYSGEPLGRMWEIQREVARSVPNTGMAGATDAKEIRNIHPNNKDIVGKRLALLALARSYGKDVPYSGPLYRDSKIEGDKMIIEFDHAGSGLAFSGDKITDVFIKGEGDADFVEALPTLEGSRLVVTHPAGIRPLHVRMGWNKGALPNLMNKEGLPASPFRTDETK